MNNTSLFEELAEAFTEALKPDYKFVCTYADDKKERDLVSVFFEKSCKGNETAKMYYVSPETVNEIVGILEEESADEDDEDEIELCPICKSSCTVSQYKDGKWYVECNYCGTSTPPMFNSKEEALNFWNHRD